MTKADEFGKPDRAGFEALLSEPFREYRGMLFRKSTFDAGLIDRRLETATAEDVQRELNHTHLFLYAEAVQVQRKWTRELEQRWSSRFAAEFPSAKIQIQKEDKAQEVIVTFWDVAGQEKSGEGQEYA